MIKSIGLVTEFRDSPLGKFLRDNLEKVFAGYAVVNNYYFAEIKPGDVFRDGVVVAMLKSKACELSGFVMNPRDIVVIKRTIQESEIYKLFSIPPGARALVVNNHPEATQETVALLHQLKINHLKLVPFEPGKNYDDIHIAITPGEKQLVPEHIGNIVDLGHRCIDISTFLQIMDRLMITAPEVNKRLLKYSTGIITLDTGIKKRYQELVSKNTELDTVINLSREGVLVVNPAGRIAMINRSLRGMLGIEEDIIGASVESVLPADIVAVLKGKELNNEVVRHRERLLVINRQTMDFYGEFAGVCYNFQEVTYIKQLEQTLTNRLHEKGLYAQYRFEDIITQSPRMRECVELARKFAGSDLTVLVTGASGTGKELVAQSIHNASDRRKYPFVAVNCAAIPESLLESELFGYERGAFTGALKGGKAGLFEQANNGTVFLDEIGDMPLALQARLLRVLQERQVMRIGSDRVIHVNIRVIAATNQDILAKVTAGLFREDLYYRLNVLPLKVPPLRERPEDVMLLLNHFIASERNGTLAFDDDSTGVLLSYPWPGNVRELMNAAAYISFIAKKTVHPNNLPGYIFDNLGDFGAEYDLLKGRCQWDKAAKVLEILDEVPGRAGGMGRKGLEGRLQALAVAISEGEIRRILSLLSATGLVCSRPGRRGSGLTAKGKAFIYWLNNRH